VTSTSDGPRRSRRSPSVASIAAVLASSSAEVGSSSSRTDGPNASVRASITRRCSPTDSASGPSCAEARNQTSQAEVRRDIGVAPRQPRTVEDVVGHGALQQSRQLGDQADLAPQREHVEVAQIPPAVAHRPARWIGEPVEQPQQRRLPRSQRPHDPRRSVRQVCAQALKHHPPTADRRQVLQLKQHGRPSSRVPARILAAAEGGPSAPTVRLGSPRGGESSASLNRRIRWDPGGSSIAA
jgi:hypothetical protein